MSADQIDEARKHFFLPIRENEVFELFDEVVARLPDPQRQVAHAFRHNLIAAADVVSIPFRLAHVNVFRKRIRRDRVKAVKALAHEPIPEEQKIRALIERATARTKAWAESEGDTEAVVLAIVQELLTMFHFDQSHDRSARELIRQGVVLVWGALEVLVDDCYRLAFGKEADGPKMGFKALVPEFKSGKDFMQELELWEIFQRRHLIVHRRSVVDEKFVKETASSLPIGSELIVTPEELEDNFDCVITTGMSVLLLSTQVVKGPA